MKASLITEGDSTKDLARYWKQTERKCFSHIDPFLPSEINYNMIYVVVDVG